MPPACLNRENPTSGGCPGATACGRNSEMAKLAALAAGAAPAAVSSMTTAPADAAPMRTTPVTAMRFLRMTISPFQGFTDGVGRGCPGIDGRRALGE